MRGAFVDTRGAAEHPRPATLTHRADSVVIELVRSQLDGRAQKRWRAALAEPPIVARPTSLLDPEIFWLSATLWLVPYLLTLGPRATPAPLFVLALRAVAAAAAFACARAATRAWRARRWEWPSGRFLYSWGYAEIENDTMRMLPLERVRHEIRGRFLGIGRITLVLRDGVSSVTLGLRPHEIEHVATALEDTSASRVDGGVGGYRDAPPAIEGRRAGRLLPRAIRELGWALVAGVIDVAVVPADLGVNERDRIATVASVATPAIEGFRAPYATALRRLGETTRADIALELERCTDTPVILSTVTSYLTLALTTPRLGPAHPFLPQLGPREIAPARVWADCTWEVDQTHGTFLRAIARWGLARHGETLVEREATIDIDRVIDMIDDCGPGSDGSALSPERLARVSLFLLNGTIRNDLFDDLDGAARALDTPRAGQCVLASVARVPVTHVRDP